MAKPTVHNPKPLLGFGWAGWCLLVVAVALAAMMIAGVDIRHWILARITWNLGSDATLWFVGHYISSTTVFDFPFLHFGWSSVPPTMRFSLITMCLAIIALQVHPRRAGVIRIMTLIALGVIIPGVSMVLISRIMRLLDGAGPRTFNPVTSVYAMCIFAAAWAIATTFALTWATRSWRLGLCIAAVQIIGCWLYIETTRGAVAAAGLRPLLFQVTGTESWHICLSWLWNPVLFAMMLVWAIRARLRVFPDHCCQSCGYDLRATPTGPCPECGNSQSRPSVDSPAAGELNTS